MINDFAQSQKMDWRHDRGTPSPLGRVPPQGADVGLRIAAPVCAPVRNDKDCHSERSEESVIPIAHISLLRRQLLLREKPTSPVTAYGGDTLPRGEGI